MNKLYIPEPTSIGIFLSYKCTSECKHCMYACSPGWQGIDMDDHPILEALTTDLKGLYQLGVDEWGYKERQEGYISKCHLCVDIRKHLATQTNRFKELRPIEFYDHLESLGGSSGHLDGNRSEDSE